MRFAVQIWGTDLDAVKAYARDAEAMGYDALRYGDGLWPWTHEGWTVLAALATLTRRIRLGPAVTYILDAAYRNPSLVAQLATSLDWLQGPRVSHALGAAHDRHAAVDARAGGGSDHPSRRARGTDARGGCRDARALPRHPSAVLGAARGALTAPGRGTRRTRG